MSLNHPATVLVIGGTGCGKSVFTRSLIENHQQTFSHLPAQPKVLWCYGIYQDSFAFPIKNTNSLFHEGLVDEDYIKTRRPDILVIDDMMNEKSDDIFVHNLFTKLSHHLNITVIFITQNLYQKGQVQMKRNAHYLVLMRSPSDKSQVMTLGRQLYPGSSHFFLEAYNDATSRKFGYLLIDVSPESEEETRLKTDIIPDSRGLCMPTVYVRK
jgi:hypothetical protein